MFGFRHVMPNLVRTDCGECSACSLDPACVWKMGALFEGNRPDQIGFYVRPSTTEPDNPLAWEARSTEAAPFPIKSKFFRMVLDFMPPGSTVDCYSGLLNEQDQVQRITAEPAPAQTSVLVPPGMVLK